MSSAEVKRRGRKPKIVTPSSKISPTSNSFSIFDKTTEDESPQVVSIPPTLPKMTNTLSNDSPLILHIPLPKLDAKPAFTNKKNIQAFNDGENSRYSNVATLHSASAQQDNNDMLNVLTNPNPSTCDIIELLPAFIELNAKDKWLTHTTIKCWWCTLQFGSMPWAIPYKHVAERYYVLGCFCSERCAYAHILNFNHPRRSEKISLLNLLVKVMTGKHPHNIRPSPPKELMKQFGGTLDEDDYREIIKSNVNGELSVPPMTSIIPTVKLSKTSSYTIDKKYIPINKTKIDEVDRKTRLARELPIKKNSHTLEGFATIKVSSSNSKN